MLNDISTYKGAGTFHSASQSKEGSVGFSQQLSDGTDLMKNGTI